jgi:hypothetical protein
MHITLLDPDGSLIPCAFPICTDLGFFNAVAVKRRCFLDEMLDIFKFYSTEPAKIAT